MTDMAEDFIELKAQLEALQLQHQQTREATHLRAAIDEERRTAMATQGADHHTGTFDISQKSGVPSQCWLLREHRM